MKRVLKLLLKAIAILLFPFYYLKDRVLDRIIREIRSEIIRYDLRFNNADVGGNLKVGRNVRIKFGKTSQILIGKNVVLGDDVYLAVKNGASLIIGDNVHINKGCRISSFKHIEIGADTLIASYCNLLDHNHDFDLKSPASTTKFISKPIKIGRGVWLGTKVQVNSGVCIKEYSVIGANAVVTKNILSNSIYAGIPAVKIK